MAQRLPFSPLRRALRARDVFGKPVRSDGVTVIPVASVIGGGGAGAGEPAASDGDAQSSSGAAGGGAAMAGAQTGASSDRGAGGAGLGFGFWARPVGAFEIRDGKARWRPAWDVTPLGMAAILAGLLMARRLLRERQRARGGPLRRRG